MDPLRSTPCAGIVGTTLPAPCFALRPARSRTLIPSSGILVIVVTRDPVLPEPHSTRTRIPTLDVLLRDHGDLGPTRTSVLERSEESSHPMPLTLHPEGVRMDCGPARPFLLLATLPTSALGPSRRRELPSLLHLNFLTPSPCPPCVFLMDSALRAEW
ncbi:hypothetical protein NN561_015253 [Cricetulus griseus]